MPSSQASERLLRPVRWHQLCADYSDDNMLFKEKLTVLVFGATLII